MASASRVRKREPRPTFGRWLRRIAQFWRGFFAPGDVPTLIVSAILILMPALALNAAGWPLEMRTVAPVALLSILFGFLLARSHYNELIGLIISSIYGASFSLLIAAINDPGDLGEGVYNTFSRLFTWIVDALSGGINQDPLVFTLLASGLFWLLGYNLVWHLFRVDRVWRAVLPPALILVTNSVYYTGASNLDGYLLVFTFLTLLLIVRSNLDSREWDWYLNGIRTPAKLRWQVFRVGTLMAVIILAFAWLIPSSDLQDRLQRFQEFLANEPLTQMSELWNRLFESAETQGPTTADYYGGDSLQLGGAIRLGDDVVFFVDAPPTRRYYWRSRVFDTYDAGRWTSAADTRLTDPEAPLEINAEPYIAGSRVPVQQQFIMGLSASRLVYAAPQPSRVDLPTRTDLRYSDASQSQMLVSVIRPMRVLYEGDTYTVTSLMNAATADQLRAAGTQYPAWVTSTYHNYIPSMTPRTAELARQIVTAAGATTPYDMARAIEAWLRVNITYNEVIPQPPPGRDAVDWVLFDLRQGYCNYYASSMVLMLRSLGVPVRMAAGFAQGQYDEAQRAYVVREKDAHTWVEVYFPGYGWIEFEPTSAQAPINRGDPDDQQQPTITPSQPTSTPSATPTPSETPTPTDTPTLDPSTTPSGEPDSAVGQEQPPTLTPTPQPTFTATPVPLPTQPPPTRPQPRGPLSFIIPALTALLVFLLVIGLLVALAFLIYWWWEWRGLRGMNPIMRAYARLERYLPLVGIRPAAEQTPDERRQVVARQLPIIEPPVTQITRLYTVERYGAPDRSAAETESRAERADRAWLAARAGIVAKWARRKFLPFLPSDDANRRYQERRAKRRKRDHDGQS